MGRADRLTSLLVILGAVAVTVLAGVLATALVIAFEIAHAIVLFLEIFARGAALT